MSSRKRHEYAELEEHFRCANFVMFANLPLMGEKPEGGLGAPPHSRNRFDVASRLEYTTYDVV